MREISILCWFCSCWLEFVFVFFFIPKGLAEILSPDLFFFFSLVKISAVHAEILLDLCIWKTNLLMLLLYFIYFLLFYLLLPWVTKCYQSLIVWWNGFYSEHMTVKLFYKPLTCFLRMKWKQKKEAYSINITYPSQQNSSSIYSTNIHFPFLPLVSKSVIDRKHSYNVEWIFKGFVLDIKIYQCDDARLMFSIMNIFHSLLVSLKIVEIIFNQNVLVFFLRFLSSWKMFIFSMSHFLMNHILISIMLISTTWIFIDCSFELTGFVKSTKNIMAEINFCTFLYLKKLWLLFLYTFVCLI